MTAGPVDRILAELCDEPEGVKFEHLIGRASTTRDVAIQVCAMLEHEGWAYEGKSGVWFATTKARANA